MKKFIFTLLTVVLLVTTLTATLATTANAAFYTQKITGSTVNSILNIIKTNEGITAYNKAYYLFYDSQYAAAYQKTFPYTNSTYPHSAVVDNGTTYAVTKSGGCMTYSNFVCKYVFGTNATSAAWKYASGSAGSLTANSIKELITNHAQFGEHIRIDGTHSISFAAYTSDGFYYTSYYTDSNPMIYIAYTTWQNFANECNSKGKRVWIYNTVTTTNSGTSGENVPITLSNGYSGKSNTISDTNAILYGTVTKPASSNASQFGIFIRKPNDTYANGWSLRHGAQADHTGETSFPIWFDINAEVGLTLTHATSYVYQLFMVVNGVEYYSPEATFTTTGTHSYGAWQTVTAAKCTTAGSQKRTCACGAVETAAISALGHSYSSAFTMDKAASCTVAGSKSRHCTRSGCTATTAVTVIPATGHSYGSWQTVTAAKCTTAGSQKRTCACGAYETQNINALGHSYSSAFTVDKAASCTVAGSKSRHCTRSDCTATTEVTAIPKNPHSYGAWQTVTKPSCTATGSQKHVCSSCSHTEYKTVAALGHDYSSAWTVDKAATCTASGTKSHHCSRCTSKSSVTTIPANGHSWSGWTVTKQATYETTGTKVRECTASGCSAEESAVIAKLSLDGHTHNFGNWVTETAATCTKNGLQKRTCSICKSSETQEITAHGHKITEWKTEKVANCTDEGVETRSCTVCHESEAHVTPAYGHNFGEWHTKVEATAESEGLLERKCNNCSETETQTTPKLNLSVDTSSNTPSDDTSEPESDPKPNPEPDADKTNGSPKGDNNNLTTVIIICSVIIGALLAALIVLVIVKKNKH